MTIETEKLVLAFLDKEGNNIRVIYNVGYILIDSGGKEKYLCKKDDLESLIDTLNKLNTDLISCIC